jgi:hypothetical protein
MKESLVCEYAAVEDSVFARFYVVNDLVDSMVQTYTMMAMMFMTENLSILFKAKINKTWFR